MKFNQYWFKPKKFGYGATPSTWEGWLTTLAFIVFFVFIVIVAPVKSCTNDVCAYNYRVLAIILSIIVLFIIFVKKKTEGNWKWSWG